MKANEDFNVEEKISVAPLEKNGKTIGMQIELYGIRLSSIFSDSPVHKQKPIKLKFIENKQGPSCEVRFI